MEDDLRKEVEQDAHQGEDDFYEDLIPKLYKPVKQKKVVEVLTQELPFEVEPAPAPEPAKEPEPAPTPVAEELPAPSMVSKWRQWLSQFIQNVAE